MHRKIEIRLCLHEGCPDGNRSWFDGEVFVSLFRLPQTHEEICDFLAALEDLGERECLALLKGEDVADERVLYTVTAGSVRDLAETLRPVLAHHDGVFTSLYLLGAPEAAQALSWVNASIRKCETCALLEVESTEEDFTSDDKLLKLSARWRLLLATAGIDLPGLSQELSSQNETARTQSADNCHPTLQNQCFYCTGRGAQGRARWNKNGLLMMAGSRSSPLDATPSLNPLFKATIKRLVNEGKLKKLDGIWTFVEDVKFASAVQAASILMRTAAGADAWKTADDISLTRLLKKR